MSWYETKPLFGQRILVARPEHQAVRTRAAIGRRGAQAVVRPALTIGPPPDPERLRQAVQELGRYDWVVFTSANGVDAVAEVLRSLRRDARAFGSARVAVIGEKTAQALEARGVLADFVAPEYVAESLAERLLDSTQPGSRLLLLRALQAREILPETLAAAGRVVDVVPAYETSAVSGEALEALGRALDGEVDVVLLTSSSMVAAVAGALGPSAAAKLARVTLVSIGPVTSATCQELGIRVDVEASVHTVDGALDALEQYRSSR
jgi:uroporphyrinogen III methyltransferase/synthase